MSAQSSIEWTDRTWNPVRGCSVISPGCVNCYAMKQAHRFTRRRQEFAFGDEWVDGPYAGLTKQTTAGPQWTGVVRTIDEALLEPLSWRKPARVFVNSMSDLFHASVPDEFIDKVFAVMAARSVHAFQILTKRPVRMRDYMTDRLRHESVIEAWSRTIPQRANRRTVEHWPLPNVWLGVSVEDQKHADERIPQLLQTPAAVRFISAEPLLGPLDVSRYVRNYRQIHLSMSVEGAIANRSFDGLTDGNRPLSRAEAEAGLRELAARGVKVISAAGGECVGFSDQAGCPGHKQPRLDWVIVGGESGAGARPCAEEWIQRVVQQCQSASVPVFVKQLGAVVVSEYRTAPAEMMTDQEKARRGFSAPNGEVWAWRAGLRDRKGGDPGEWPPVLRVREFPKEATWSR
jgi:protein gp37